MHGKAALITGAASGIGKGLALELAAAGVALTRELTYKDLQGCSHQWTAVQQQTLHLFVWSTCASLGLSWLWGSPSMRLLCRTAVPPGSPSKYSLAPHPTLPTPTPFAVADIDSAAAERVASEVQRLGGRAIAVPCDVSDPAQHVEAFRRHARAWGRLDYALLNAGACGRMHVACVRMQGRAVGGSCAASPRRRTQPGYRPCPRARLAANRGTSCARGLHLQASGRAETCCGAAAPLPGRRRWMSTCGR